MVRPLIEGGGVNHLNHEGKNGRKIMDHLGLGIPRVPISGP